MALPKEPPSRSLRWKGYRIPWPPKADINCHHMQHKPDYDIFHGFMDYLHTEERTHFFATLTGTAAIVNDSLRHSFTSLSSRRPA